MADNWIKEAIGKPGALHKELGIPTKKTIPTSTLNKAAKSKNPTLRKRAVLAKTLGRMNKK